MSRTVATARLYGAVLWLLGAIILAGLRETLPDSEETAGVWLAGFTWAMVIHWALLIVVSWLWLQSVGR